MDDLKLRAAKWQQGLEEQNRLLCEWMEAEDRVRQAKEALNEARWVSDRVSYGWRAPLS